MWNQFKFLNKDPEVAFRARLRRLLIGWAIWSVIVFILFAGFWLWQGMPKGPDGVIMTWIQIAVISLIAPPIVWLIGKAVIG